MPHPLYNFVPGGFWLTAYRVIDNAPWGPAPRCKSTVGGVFCQCGFFAFKQKRSRFLNGISFFNGSMAVMGVSPVTPWIVTCPGSIGFPSDVYALAGSFIVYTSLI